MTAINGAAAAVTGAASGIGRALALELAARGCDLALADRDEAGLKSVAAEIAKAMGPRDIKVNARTGHYSIVPYQTTHNTGGAIMGTDPKSGVLNRYLQSWDVPNLFLMGAGAFPQNPGYNPTGTVAALAYWAVDAIKTQYLKNPGPLVQA